MYCSESLMKEGKKKAEKMGGTLNSVSLRKHVFFRREHRTYSFGYIDRFLQYIVREKEHFSFCFILLCEYVLLVSSPSLSNLLVTWVILEVKKKTVYYRNFLQKYQTLYHLIKPGSTNWLLVQLYWFQNAAQSRSDSLQQQL